MAKICLLLVWSHWKTINCTDIPNLPVAVAFHASTVLNGDIVTCGGMDENGDILDTC